ncbi:GNAT family N-acetyltransferase [Okeania sp. SIO3B5]|uniref:GNAT family N-acetyltransferase n=1 Tax=Okeania sp. SIO3B5 TaxID=2607811 RepID=UPI0025D78EB1|nr:GNAT family N-acetyltransferase [Okeania sp. SIO3B5]
MLENLNIRTANLSENYIIAEHFYKMFQDMGVPTDSIESNWLEITKEYIDNARKKLSYQGFIAEVNNTIVGSASCQIFAGFTPIILKPEYLKYGYIWGVYVEANYRRQGIAKKLTGEAIAYLKSISCTKAILRASPQGKLLYSHLGFDENNGMMQLDLS